ncbi:CheY-like superfamily [Powellomyces hirtus]|nr:CheY-like superfamily [Powellomyces hirtus]
MSTESKKSCFNLLLQLQVRKKDLTPSTSEAKQIIQDFTTNVVELVEGLHTSLYDSSDQDTRTSNKNSSENTEQFQVELGWTIPNHVTPATLEPLADTPTIHILFADDDVITQRMFERYWKKYSPRVSVSTASDGVQAIALFKKQRFSIAFTDIEMPFKDGLTVVSEIRAFERETSSPPVPVIGVSGYSTRSYQEKGKTMYFNRETSTFKDKASVDAIVKTFEDDPVFSIVPENVRREILDAFYKDLAENRVEELLRESKPKTPRKRKAAPKKEDEDSKKKSAPKKKSFDVRRAAMSGKEEEPVAIFGDQTEDKE